MWLNGVEIAREKERERERERVTHRVCTVCKSIKLFPFGQTKGVVPPPGFRDWLPQPSAFSNELSMKYPDINLIVSLEMDGVQSEEVVE